MDPSTVIALLSLNLICIGGLLLLIARRMVDSAGLRGWGLGALCFGASYLVRLRLPVDTTQPLALLSDTGMVFASLCFFNGLQRFSKSSSLSLRVTGLVVLAYACVATVASLAWGSSGRYAVLNLSLGLGYGALAVRSGALSSTEIAVLRVPMRLLASMMAGLSVATVLRGFAVMWLGSGPLFAGVWAQAFYSYSIAVTMLLGPNLLWMVFMRLNDRLGALATHDPLTGLLNRHGLEEAVQRHFGGRPPAPMVLLLMDVDHFKHINDSLGHAAGDLLLQGLAQTLQTQVRAGDALARWGGEEFLICCQGADPEWALTLAERLRHAVETTRHIGPNGVLLSCTISIGVSHAFSERSAWAVAARAADTALYGAKRAGRNRVERGAATAASPVANPAAQATKLPAMI